MTDIEEALRFFSNARFLRMLDSEGRKKLLASAQAVTFTDGQAVVREGEPGDSLYIIVSGIASVVADNFGEEKKVAELSDGSFFGEMAVITDQPRSASVIALGDLSLLKIPKKDVLQILEEYPKVKEVVAKIGLARTEDTMEKILED